MMREVGGEIAESGTPPCKTRAITGLKVMIVQICFRQLFKVPPGQWANVIIRLLTECVLITVIILNVPP